MSRRFHFDIHAAIPAAFALIWKHKEERRRDDDPTSFHFDEHFYVTASDVENQVRRFARETVDGKPWGSTGLAWGYGGHEGVRLPGDLNSRVRSWLLNNRELERHNFGKGHISGMRFRPRGTGLSEAEKKTFAKIEKEKANRLAGKKPPRHFSKHYGGTLLCTADRKRSAFSRGRRRMGMTTSAVAEVTCPRCKKLLEAATNN